MKQNISEMHEQATNKELLEKFIVLEINNENFIIPLLYVNEIVRVQEVTEAPHQPSWIKGIMNLRDSVISLVDTRRRLGMKSFIEEIHTILIKSREAHIKKISALDKLTQFFNVTDWKEIESEPCTFDSMLKLLLSKYDLNDALKRKMRDVEFAHSNLHIKISELSRLFNNEDIPAATNGVEEIQRNHLSKFITSLDEALQCLLDIASNNIAVIIEFNGSHFAMLADEIKKMQTFDLDKRQKGSLTDNPFIMGVFDNEEGLYQELDLKGILNDPDVDILHEPKQTINLKELGKQAAKTEIAEAIA